MRLIKMKLSKPPIPTRLHRRSGKGNCYKKLYAGHQKSYNGTKRESIRETSPCDNSDDSGLGIENSPEYYSYTNNSNYPHPSVFRFATTQKRSSEELYEQGSKRPRVDPKIGNHFTDLYPYTIPPATLTTSNSISNTPSGPQISLPVASKSMRKSFMPGKRLLTGPITLSSQLNSTSRNGKVQLQILNQPEQQHRARYQTEGSRGAVKDRTGNSFPVVKIGGYDKLTTLQVFIGSDQGRVAPHMFYQACRVTGKNSTPCTEKNIEGTIVIEIDIEPTKDMTVICDCVGILKERNVDVEHRFPDECSTRSKKKSTRCRMVFRTTITNDDGTTETLQVASQPIACTQPPGVPEICKKSLTSCPVSGGTELFILGKNFLKDTQVVFQTEDWKQSVNPDKEFLQQTHLVCVVPSYKTREITEPIAAKVNIVSGNRASEPHSFTFIPLSGSSAMSPSTSSSCSMLTDSSISQGSPETESAKNSENVSGLNHISETGIKTSSPALDECDSVHPVLIWPSGSENCGLRNGSKMMQPPMSAMLPRRSSVHMIVPENMQTDLTAPTADALSPTTNGQLNGGPPFAQMPFSSLPEARPPLMSDFTRNFQTISDVEATLKTLKTEPNLEPLTDSVSMSCAVAKPMSNGSETQAQRCLVSNSNASSAMCISQSTNMYRDNENFMNMYADAITKSEQLENNSPVAELTPYDGGVTTTMASSSNATDLILASASLKQSNADSAVSFLNSPAPLQMNSVNLLPTAIRPQIDSSAFAKQRNFEFSKLLTQQHQQQQQQLTNCLMKSSPSYEDVRSAVCYENSPSSAEASTVEMYPSYLTLDTNSNLASAAEMYRKSPENKTVVTSPTDSSMLLDSYSTALTASKTQQTLVNETNFLNSQSPDTSSLNHFVPSALVSDATNSVPKLEELVNSTADSFLQSANQRASALSLTTVANGVPDSMSLDTFLNAGTGRSTLMNNVICNGLSLTGENCTQNNALAPVSQSVFQCNGMMANSISKNLIKESEKSLQSEMKKNADNVFQSDLGRISDSELFNYISTNCFDEEKFVSTLPNM